MLNFHVTSLFPEFFESPLATGLMGKAIRARLIGVSFHNPRDFAPGPHRHVDDRPYGGGPGMVIQAAPVAAAIRSIKEPGRLLLMSPAGRPFDQQLARELAGCGHISLICGRYEGIDARIEKLFPLEKISMLDAVLNGGECAALALMEAVGRLVPGFMGTLASGADESFSHGLLEYPHYTRPDELEGQIVPEILAQGHHARIAEWRRARALEATLRQRPDLLDRAPLTAKDAEILMRAPRCRPGRRLCFCLVHHPVLLERRRCGTSSLTNLDIHDIARISCTYGMGPFLVVSPLEDQLKLLERILQHWQGPAAHEDRRRALSSVQPCASLDEALAWLGRHFGQEPVVVASSAAWPERKCRLPLLAPADVRGLLAESPVLILLGTARGLAPEALQICGARLRPLRYLGYNHLSVRSAAAILADRILGDYF